MNKSLLTAFGVGLTLAAMFGSCQVVNNKTVDIKEMKKDTTVYLVANDTKSPSCKFELEYKYLTSNIENDSITQLINQKIQHFVSDGKLKGEDIQSFPNRMASLYLKNYNKDVKDLYQADLYNNIAPEEVPSWYNYEYAIATDMNKGYQDCWNYEVEEFQYTGGAHPNTFARKTNIDSKTGKILKKQDVFQRGSDTQICEIILKHLIEVVNEKMDEESIKNIEDLREVGLLLDADLFIPDNFLLKENEIEFYYNRYEIGPYVVGDFEVNVPYHELNQYIILK